MLTAVQVNTVYHHVKFQTALSRNNNRHWENVSVKAFVIESRTLKLQLPPLASTHAHNKHAKFEHISIMTYEKVQLSVGPLPLLWP